MHVLIPFHNEILSTWDPSQVEWQGCSQELHHKVAQGRFCRNHYLGADHSPSNGEHEDAKIHACWVRETFMERLSGREREGHLSVKCLVRLLITVHQRLRRRCWIRVEHKSLPLLIPAMNESAALVSNDLRGGIFAWLRLYPDEMSIIPTIGRKSASSEYPAPLMNAFHRHNLNALSPLVHDGRMSAFLQGTPPSWVHTRMLTCYSKAVEFSRALCEAISSEYRMIEAWRGSSSRSAHEVLGRLTGDRCHH